ncbi:MAG: hypothetical protein QOI36_990, partial [Pseudonocardiales bacterium]|nr:hypothetical protein [Pseudonocardiales bacterium]
MTRWPRETRTGRLQSRTFESVRWASLSRVDGKTGELRDAHDVLAEMYADRLANVLDEMPIERAVLGLFRELVLDSGVGSSVG